MNGHGEPNKVDELDLAIPNLNTEEDEERAGAVLKGMRGVVDVRMMQRGAFVRYHGQTVTHEAIIYALHHAGFRASVFQDSKTGKTGKSSQ